MPDNTLNFTTRVDTSGLRTGMQQAASAVQASSQTMAQAMSAATVAANNLSQAQQQLGASAARGNQQAAAVIQQYQAAANQTTAAVQQLAAAQATQTATATTNAVANQAAATAVNNLGSAASHTVPQVAAASGAIRVLEGALPIRAVERFLVTTLGLGPVLQAAFPIAGAIALGEMLVDMAGKVANLYDEFVNLRSLQNEVWKDLSAGEERAITLSNEHLKLLREQQVLLAENRGDKTGRSARGEEAGANFDLAQAKNNLAIVNAQVKEYRQNVADIKDRADFVSMFGADSSDAKAAAIELPNAQQKLDNALAEQKNLQTEISNAQQQSVLRKQQEAEAEAQLAKSEEARALAADRETGALIDREAKQEEALFKKLQDIQNRGNENVGRMPLEKDETLDANAAAEIKLNQAKIDATQIEQDNANAIAAASIRAQQADGTITALGAAQAIAAQHAQEYKDQLEALTDQLEVYEEAAREFRESGDDVLAKEKEAAAAQTRNQITQVQGKQTVSGIQDQAAIAQQATNPWITGANRVSSAWTGAFDSILRGGQQSWGAVARAGEQTVLGLINGAERLALNWVEMEVKKVVAHQISNQTIVASDASAAAQSTLISQTSAIQQIGHEAAVVFAKVYAALADIPIVGPVIAPVAAAGAYAGVVAMAAFEEGTTYVPKTGMAILHEGEAVFPKPQAQQYRDFIRGGTQDGQASGTNIRDINLHYHGGQNSGPEDLMKTFHRKARRMGLTQ